MTTSEVALTYGISREAFEKFIRKNGLEFYEGLGGMTVRDGDVSSYVNKYNYYLNNLKAENNEIRKQDAAEEEKKRIAMTGILITSGFSFDGYSIKKYSGYISGDDCITIPRDSFWGHDNLPNMLCDSLVQIRRKAILELKEAAYNLGCNAVIGVDFDYLTMDPQHNYGVSSYTVYDPYVICVTANGNAVVIEKE